MKLEFQMDIEKDSASTTHTNLSFLDCLPFIVKSAGFMKARRKYYTEREGLESYLLFYTLDGSGVLTYQDNDYSLKPGQAAFIDCRNYQYYKTSEEGFWKFKWIHFTGIASESYYKLINNNGLKIISLPGKTSMDFQMNEVIRLSNYNGINVDAGLSNHISEIMTLLLEYKYTAQGSSDLALHKKDLDAVINYIHTNYQRNICTDDLAKLALLSKFHFSRIFKSYSGLSPYEFLICYRINLSKTLLRSTQLTVKDISEQIGFRDVNNYIKQFKRYEGMSPLKYRHCHVV